MSEKKYTIVLGVAGSIAAYKGADLASRLTKRGHDVHCVLTVSTVNVNGLRAAAKKGFVEWLATTKADVVACQEVRAEASQLPAAVVEPEGWFSVHAPSAAKGRNGVAVYSRVEPEEVRVGFGEPEFEQSGRYLEAHLPGVVVASLYLPSGDVGTERQDEKERFMAAFLPYLVELRAKAAELVDPIKRRIRELITGNGEGWSSRTLRLIQRFRKSVHEAR